MEHGVKTRNRREELGFRAPMAVKELAVYRGGSAYPLCPRCRIPLDREYQRFCDRCGQRLDWRGYRHAKIIYSGSGFPPNAVGKCRPSQLVKN